ncbi:Thioredoxin [Labilithrix luteola]|uniref:Thioredoxin n=1 Tax=Labilithrix luteola TaxID=1391654 RepID=A0A0K1PM26_9BACT|nr:thioredoxin [Labilithrix luteola]AKU94159.1 Thioredoxin [Labilithrix luteola]
MAKSKNVLELDDVTFDKEVLESDIPVLVDFGATWCGPCKALDPVVDKIADENVGRYKIVKLDIDDSPAIAKRYGIRGAPTLLVFRGGEKRASQLGVTTKQRLLELLES